MSNQWIPWSNRNEEFAPVFGLHKYEMFYPTKIEAFLKDSCELMVLIGTDSSGPIYRKIEKFAQGSMMEKMQWMLHPKMNKKYNYLDRHSGQIDMKKSAKIQQSEPTQLYVWGFQNKATGQAYVTYWFFYVENFMPSRTTDDVEIADVLDNRPGTWWTHQGDWEALSIHFKDFEANNPTEVIFEQHNKSEAISWDAVEKEKGRICAFTALGSHATYNKTQRKPVFLFYIDISSPDVLYYPKSIADNTVNSYYLEELDPRHGHLWLGFKGRWGRSGGELTPSPQGPMMKKKKHLRFLAAL